MKVVRSTAGLRQAGSIQVRAVGSLGGLGFMTTDEQRSEPALGWRV